MSCSLSLQLCIRFCNGSANQYQKRAGLKKPGRCKHTETEDGTVGCQLLVGRSLTKHLHHRPYLLRENIVSSVITAVLHSYPTGKCGRQQVISWEEVWSYLILEFYFTKDRYMFGQKEELRFSLIPLPHYELLI